LPVINRLDRAAQVGLGFGLSAAMLALSLSFTPTWAASDKGAASATTNPAIAPAEPAAAPASAVGASLAKLLGGAGDNLTVAGIQIPGQVLDSSYAGANDQPIWTDDGGLGPRGAALVDGFQAAKAAGMDMLDPQLAAIGTLTGAKAPDDIAMLEALLSATLLAAMQDSGDLAPADLLAAARQGDARIFIADHLPSTLLYWRLAHAVPVYRRYAAEDNWPTISSGPKLEKGMTDPRVAILGQRLLATGELAALGAKPDSFDDALAEALRKFQTSHGLDPDGKVGPQTLAALNVPADQRLGSILLNLARFRKLNSAMGERYLFINVAGMELSLVEHGQVTFFNKVIVGRRDRPTPLLQSVIRRIDFNPTWVVPAKIARIDEVNRMRADPTFFRTHNIRVFDGWGAGAREIDPATVDWSQYGPNNMPFALRQDPGPENALGPVKFDFANDYAVYVHGTPVQSLFSLAARSLSSGCVRTEHPVDLAAYLLRNDKNWQRSRIDDVVHKATTVSAPLAEPLPIMLTYETAWADKDGIVQFRPDIYALDSSSDVPTTASPIVPKAAPAPGQVNTGKKN
jgi:murein L,D-transpeptidase YcbB/YkuD